MSTIPIVPRDFDSNRPLSFKSPQKRSFATSSRITDCMLLYRHTRTHAHRCNHSFTSNNAHINGTRIGHIDGLMQKRRNSSALTMALRLFGIKPSILLIGQHCITQTLQPRVYFTMYIHAFYVFLVRRSATNALR